MGKVYKYNQLKGVIRVGMDVKAVEGKDNSCYRLENGQTQRITNYYPDRFQIDGCEHDYDEDGWLEIVSGLEKTLDNLEVGDLIIAESGTKRVLAVCGELTALSSVDGYEELDAWWTKKEMADRGFVINIEVSEIQEMTVEEISKELGREIKVVKSK